MSSDPLQFINEEVKVGLQRLVCLRLEGTPPADILGFTGQIWVDAMRQLPIGWNETQDKGRITASFNVLIRQSARWPAIKHLIDNLPKRVPLPTLAAPKITPKQRKEGKEKLNQILQTLEIKMMPSEHDGRQALNQAIETMKLKKD